MAQTISATDVELQKPVNAVFEQQFLRRAQQTCPFFAGTLPGTSEQAAGLGHDHVAAYRAGHAHHHGADRTHHHRLVHAGPRFRRPASFANVTAAVPSTASSTSSTRKWTCTTRTTGKRACRVLGEAAGRSLNQLMRDVLRTTRRSAMLRTWRPRPSSTPS
jgi:hypothetical protein